MSPTTCAKNWHHLYVKPENWKKQSTVFTIIKMDNTAAHLGMFLASVTTYQCRAALQVR
jgi:hypothetical protein